MNGKQKRSQLQIRLVFLQNGFLSPHVDAGRRTAGEPQPCITFLAFGQVNPIKTREQDRRQRKAWQTSCQHHGLTPWTSDRGAYVRRPCLPGLGTTARAPFAPGPCMHGPWRIGDGMEHTGATRGRSEEKPRRARVLVFFSRGTRILSCPPRPRRSDGCPSTSFSLGRAGNAQHSFAASSVGEPGRVGSGPPHGARVSRRPAVLWQDQASSPVGSTRPARRLVGVCYTSYHLFSVCRTPEFVVSGDS